MDDRRAFLKKAAFLAGGLSLWETLPPSIQRAMAIDPAPGSTYLDAEHIVFLMQENRSFDHAFGTLRGVRGFNDPRAITLGGGHPVWLQTNAKGETYCPFRLDMKGTRATWMSSLPHSYESQVDARSDGRMDRWLDAKKGDYPGIPMTMGYYSRQDIPFYYALADAFTVCDQHFCSSLTGTTPNRLHFWTGTIRSGQDGKAPANVRNEEVDYGAWVHWTTFPERLEAAGVPWKVYQNEVSIDSGLKGEEDAWLSSFTDNPLEWFTQYNIQFSPAHIAYVRQAVLELHAVENKTQDQQKKLAGMIQVLQQYTPEAYAALPEERKNLHEKAFVTNSKSPDYRSLTTLTYGDGGMQRSVEMPGGDVLYQFREDVDKGNLPAVSWLVAPERFSDHPGSAWYGAWYVSEVLDILTKNPEVWKKTIFILSYDENDGCFDHVPPFVAPYPHRPDTGKTSKGIDTSLDYVFMDQEVGRVPFKNVRESPIGLGFRVPFVVVSPWSRGGWVNSEVFDHTSNLQFLEYFIERKWNKQVRETNISPWRRLITGNLTSVFRPYNGEAIVQPAFLEQKAVIESIHKAQFKGLPDNYKNLTRADIDLILEDPGQSPYMPRQEPGTKPSNALPYELYAEGGLNRERNAFLLHLESRKNRAEPQAEGTPFLVYAPGTYLQSPLAHAGASAPVVPSMLPVKNWSYAVATGDALSDSFPLASFGEDRYHLCVYGPNGFYREFKGDGGDPALSVACHYPLGEGGAGRPTGDIELFFINKGAQTQYNIQVSDPAYKKNDKRFSIDFDRETHGDSPFVLQLDGTSGWYDVIVRVDGYETFEVRYAGRVETGEHSITDPFMGRTT